MKRNVYISFHREYASNLISIIVVTTVFIIEEVNLRKRVTEIVIYERKKILYRILRGALTLELTESDRKFYNPSGIFNIIVELSEIF